MTFAGNGLRAERIDFGDGCGFFVDSRCCCCCCWGTIFALFDVYVLVGIE